MSDTYALIDVPNLAYRNFHAMGQAFGRSYKLRSLYGLFRDMGVLAQRLGKLKFVFCFDGEESIRKRLYPEYKSNRLNSLEKQEVKSEIHCTEEVLKEMGFANVLHTREAEADDWLGLLCESKKYDPSTTYYLVTSDMDVFQLLSNKNKVFVWSPSIKIIIEEDYVWSRFNVRPSEWAWFRAITGDRTDNIKGVNRIGPVGAAEHIRGITNRCATNALEKEENKEIVRRNMDLMTLPCPHLWPKEQTISLGTDTVDQKTWRRVCTLYNFESLTERYPL